VHVPRTVLTETFFAVVRRSRRLLYAERQARDEAERARALAVRAAARANAIQAATAALAGALSMEQVRQAVALHALTVLNASASTLLLLSEGADELQMVSSGGLPEGVAASYYRLPLHAETPGVEAVRTALPVWLESTPAGRRRFPYWAEHPTGNQAVAALPLVMQATSIGALIVAFKAERHFDAEDRAFLLTLAAQCAIAVHRVQLLDAADRARSQAQAALRARDEFLRTLSHDLKAPLVSLGWNVEVLKRALSDRGDAVHPAELEAFGGIEASATELLADIDELRDLVSTQSGGSSLPLHTEDMDLADLVRQLVSANVAQLGAPVRLEGGETPLVVHGDPARLRRAFENVLDNANKYSPSDTEVVVTIECQDRAGAPWGIVHVRDGGLGIPADDLPSIFERYHRGANVGRIPGQGIGLASARQIVTRHAGQITVQSREGAGTTFTVALPLLRGGSLARG
jgi:signal transduction histidine kinase